MEQKLAVRLEDVTFRYFKNGKRNILDHVSLDVKAGEITVLMGSSGCGKSTLAAVLAGLYPENGGFLESGTIELFGRPLSSMNTKERAGYLTEMFQNPDLQFCMDTLRGEMRFCLENICVPPQEMDERILRAAEQCKTTALLDQRLHTLSGGEKQRATLSCLYAMDSRMILLDEAFANLDPEAVRELMPLLKQMKQEGKTILAIDHQVSFWIDEADEIILLGEGGRVRMRGISRETIRTEKVRRVFEEEGLFWIEDVQDQPQSETGTVSEAEGEAPAMLEFENVSIPRGIPKKRWLREEPWELLLKEARLRVPKGSITAILGASGSGKTTTFLSILKQHPYRGTIRVEGQDLSRIREKELFLKVGVVFQNPANQFITQNVLEEVMESLKLWNRGINEAECRERALELLERYGLKQYQSYSPYMLSQGQQRRLAVLSVLAGGQKLLLLDEPTYGQDLKSVLAIMNQLKERVREEGLTVVFITHDRLTASLFADQIYVLKDRELQLKEKGERYEAGTD